MGKLLWKPNKSSATELDEALKSTSLSSLNAKVLQGAVDEAPNKELSYDGWKKAIKAAGGASWQRMLFAGVDESGKLKGILTLDELFQQKKEQCKAIKQRLATVEADDAAKAELQVTVKEIHGWFQPTRNKESPAFFWVSFS